MNFANVKSITIPEGNVKKIIANGVALWQKIVGLINWALHSINPDGSIYNNGQGYKSGYRIRSGGAEAEQSASVCTGFIPLKKGETLEIYPAFTGGNIDNAINFADANFTNLGQFVDGGTAYGICTSAYKSSVVDGKSVLTLDDRHSADIAYVRITHNIEATANGSNMVITVKPDGYTRLPAEYQAVEWLEPWQQSPSSGTYIDLGFAFDTGATIYMDGYAETIAGGHQIFGAAESSGKYRCMITHGLTLYFYGSDGSKYLAAAMSGTAGDFSWKYTLKPGKIEGLDLLHGKTATYTTNVEFTMTRNLYLFAQNYNTAARFAGIHHIKMFKYYDKTDTLICDLVPCYRKSDGVIGMYDLARKMFLTNAGTGTFRKGADV